MALLSICSLARATLVDYTFFVTLLPVGNLTLFDEFGEVEGFREEDCPCTVMLRESRTIGVKADSSDDFKGFVL